MTQQRLRDLLYFFIFFLDVQPIIEVNLVQFNFHELFALILFLGYQLIFFAVPVGVQINFNLPFDQHFYFPNPVPEKWQIDL